VPVTERLILREPVLGDLDQLSAINADPEVARFVSRTGPLTRDQTQALLERSIEHWREHGFGWWMADLRETGELTGFVGLAHPTFVPEIAHEVEVGWRIGRPYWGRGLATEAARAALELGFGELGLRRIVSIIDPSNARSIRVAEKLGLRRERELRHALWPVPVSLYVRTP